MYKAIQNNKYYFAVNRFRRAAKKGQWNHAYKNGFRKWESDDMKTYAFILGRFRIMFGIKKPQFSSCNS